MSLIRISESDDWIVDYDKERGMYRVSYFEDCHFKDEYWFDAYEEKEVNMTNADFREIFKKDALNGYVERFDCSVNDLKQLGYTDEEAEEIFKRVSIDA